MKRGITILLIFMLLFATTLVISQEQDDVDKAYACLEDRLGDDCGDTRSTINAAFNLMAMAYKSSIRSDCRSSLTDKENEDESCFGNTADDLCNIKATAIATLALDYIGRNVDDYVEWLLDNKKQTTTELTWYLEIDANNETICDINGAEVTIQDNKKISGINPQGLSKAYDNYWFKINDLDRNYTISCDKDFISTLLYKKPSSTTYHVSSNTHYAAAYDTTTEKVESYCFTTTSTCDYEASLWAAFALQKAEEDINAYIPYLTAMADETANKRYLPLAFLNIMVPADDYTSQLIDLQKQGQYWEVSGNKFYDTAIALLGLQFEGLEAVSNTKTYLLSIQDEEGCWPSDTALILHAAWPKNPSRGGEDGGDSLNRDCEAFGHYCLALGECALEDKLPNFDCPSLSESCCASQPPLETCEQKLGEICQSDQECSTATIPASDTNNCCTGTCEDIITINECEQGGYDCSDECSRGEEEVDALSNECGFGEVCCRDKERGRFSWWLIILLIILIILVILAIIFRDRLKTWWQKRRGKKPKQPPERPMPLGVARPGATRPRGLQRPPRRGPNPYAPVRPPKSRKKDTTFDDTMKKLRDMSK